MKIDRLLPLTGQCALIFLRPILAGVGKPKMGGKLKNSSSIDEHYEAVRQHNHAHRRPAHCRVTTDKVLSMLFPQVPDSMPGIADSGTGCYTRNHHARRNDRAPLPKTPGGSAVHPWAAPILHNDRFRYAWPTPSDVRIAGAASV
jgi:hypothetical protein